jgi:hypothetical protein
MIGKQCFGWLLYPEDSARVVTIDSKADFLQLGNTYGWHVGHWEQPIFGGAMAARSRPVHSLNFPAMINDFDGVRVTDQALECLVSKEPGEYKLACWEAESTIWFRWCFTRVEPVGSASQHKKDRDVFKILSRSMRSYDAAACAG